MIYILDTGFFIVAREYYIDVFPSFWRKLNEAYLQQRISSVDEVRKEIEKYGGQQTQLLHWVKQHRAIFTRPSEDEQNIITSIFSNEVYRRALDTRVRLRGDPWADPFVIAKAKHLHAVVVTSELPAKRDKNGNINGAPKIPDICQDMQIRCISPEQFMKDLSWTF